jgi:hypothetical protein
LLLLLLLLLLQLLLLRCLVSLAAATLAPQGRQSVSEVVVGEGRKLDVV